MVKVHEGRLVPHSGDFGIVVSRFNDFISGRLLDGARDALVRHGVAEDNIHVYWVPGSFEIPAVARKIVSEGSFAAVICLGAVIRGQTPHFDYVASEAAKGIAQVSMASDVPVTFGVITADNLEQAIDRAGAKAGNKGADAALAALELANLYGEIGR